MTGEAFAHLNVCPDADARALLTRCCGATRWVEEMLRRRPFADAQALRSAAEAVWAGMERSDILEAFSHHPPIGGDLAALRAKFAATLAWASEEQGGVTQASDDTLRKLKAGNLAYEARFGYIFIVFASGKSAAEMLALLEARLTHGQDEELVIAAREQAAIMGMRLEKLL